MPTMTEFEELDNKCQWEWITYKDVKGYKVTGPNGNSVFFPAAGGRSGEDVYNRGSNGNYWSGSLSSGISESACNLYFDSGYRIPSGNFVRYGGRSVRPVSD